MKAAYKQRTSIGTLSTTTRDQVVLAVIAIDSVAEVSGIFGEELCVSRHGGRDELKTAYGQERQMMKKILFVDPFEFLKLPKSMPSSRLVAMMLN